MPVDDDDHTNTDYFKSPKPKSSAFSEQFEEPPITVKESPDSVVDKCLLVRYLHTTIIEQ